MARSEVIAALLAGLPLAALATEPAARPTAAAAAPARSAAAATEAATGRDVDAARASVEDLDFLEFLGEEWGGDQAFDDFLLSREFDRAVSRNGKARPEAAKDDER